MKKVTLSLLAATAVLLPGCSSDDLLDNAPNGDGTVTFTLTAPQAIQSRAIAEGDAANDLRVIVFDSDGNLLFTDKHQNLFAGTSQAKVRVNLVKDETYTVAFWVDDEFSYPIDANGIISMGYDGSILANNDNRDAFYAAREITVKSTALNQSIVLTRPFAQINVGTSDYELATATLKKDYSKSSMKYTGAIYNQMNLVDGEVAGTPLSSVEFAISDHTSEVLKVGGDSYTWLAMDYLLVEPSGSTLSTVELNLYAADEIASISAPMSFTSVPAKRNFRTNIVGNLLTDATNWNVTLDKEPQDGPTITAGKMTWAEFLAAQGLDMSVGTTNTDIVLDGHGAITITDWVDAWYAGNLTVTGMIFERGATFTPAADGINGVVKIENNIFYPCSRPELDVLYAANNNLRLDNSGDGLCLDIETKNSPALEVIVRNNTFVGENDPNLPRKYARIPTDPTNLKGRGHAVCINGITGGGASNVCKQVTIDGNKMMGIRGNAIQLYAFNYPITVSNNIINSWGINKETYNLLNDDSAIRGDILAGSDPSILTIENNYFGMDEQTAANSGNGVRHINVNGFDANTNGARKAGTYTEKAVSNGAVVSIGSTVTCITPALPAGVDEADFATNTAAAVSIDSNGDPVFYPNTAAGMQAAVTAGGELYLAPNSTVAWSSHIKVPREGIVVHGNGATILGGERDFSVQHGTNYTLYK